MLVPTIYDMMRANMPKSWLQHIGVHHMQHYARQHAETIFVSMLVRTIYKKTLKCNLIMQLLPPRTEDGN